MKKYVNIKNLIKYFLVISVILITLFIIGKVNADHGGIHIPCGPECAPPPGEPPPGEPPPGEPPPEPQGYQGPSEGYAPEAYEFYESYESYESYQGYEGYEGYEEYEEYEGYENYEGYEGYESYGAGDPSCAAPGILTHSDTNQSGGGQVQFTWSAVSGATQYTIQRQSGGGNWNTRGTTSSTSWGPDNDGGSDPDWRIFVSLSDGSCTVPGDNITFDPGGIVPTATPTPTPTPPPALILSGAVVIDNAGNNCASGTTPYASGATVTVYNSGGSPTGNDSTDGSGAYLISDATAPGNKTAGLSNVGSYQVRRIRFDGGSWITAGLSGFTYGPFSFSSNHTLDWCINNVTPWFQTTTGNVRMGTLFNNVPAGQYGSTDPTNPSLFFSSSFNSDFGAGNASSIGWNVDDEYSYQDDSKKRLGSSSFTFYKTRANQKNVATEALRGCSGGACTTRMVNLETGVYLNTGDLTIAFPYLHRPGTHVLVLVDGNVTIQTNISVPVGADNLLIIAAKGNITVDRSVGSLDPANTASHIQGMLTAEGSIIAEGDSCQGGSPDSRLNVEGSLIANSLRPFDVGGAGKVVNNRSLCLEDQRYPSLHIAPRYDFVTQLTDFYKIPYTRWREANP